MQPRHFMSVVAAATLWGTGGLLGTLLAQRDGIPPASIAMWRMLIAGLALSAWLLARRALALRALDRPMAIRILATGSLTAIFEVLYFAGIALAGVGLATLVAIGSAPVWVALWDWWRRGDRPTGRRVLALVVAVVGLVTLLGSSLSVADGATLGVLVALVTGATFAGVTVVNREPVPGLGAARLTALSFAAGGVLLVPVASVLGWGAPSGAASWGLATALGVVSTALAYVLYLGGLRTVPPFVATIVSLLEPLVAAVLAAIVFSERLGWTGIAGGLALGAAIVLLRPQRDEPESIH